MAAIPNTIINIFPFQTGRADLSDMADNLSGQSSIDEGDKTFKELEQSGDISDDDGYKLKKQETPGLLMSNDSLAQALEPAFPSTKGPAANASKEGVTSSEKRRMMAFGQGQTLPTTRPTTLPTTLNTSPTTTPTTYQTTYPTTTPTTRKTKKPAKHKQDNLVKPDKRFINVIGSRVSCKIAKQKVTKPGTLRWVGYLPKFPHTNSYLIAGVELAKADRLGTNGSYQGKRYFKALPERGYFFHLKQCKLIKNVHG